MSEMEKTTDWSNQESDPHSNLNRNSEAGFQALLELNHFIMEHQPIDAKRGEVAWCEAVLEIYTFAYRHTVKNYCNGEVEDGRRDDNRSVVAQLEAVLDVHGHDLTNQRAD